MEKEIIIINLSDEKLNRLAEIATEGKMSEGERANVLLKYKNLLDYDAITKEEYAEIKKRLLKGI